MSSKANFPTVVIVEEGMREGLQIERLGIPVSQKAELLDALSRTGIRRIAVGSFVSAKWVPQMAQVDELIAAFTPVDGVEYTALALNERGRERYRAFVPPLSPRPGPPATLVHLCDVFVRRNTNRSTAQEMDDWPAVVARALGSSGRDAGIGINAAWGSNWAGRFTLDQRMDYLERQHALWTDNGFTVRQVFIGDPMGWNSPGAVARQLRAIIARWPEITTFHLHLHDTRGMALASAYVALTELDGRHRLVLDSCIGGIGGCPYCGNGRAAGLLCTEDVVQMLEAEGISTGIDLKLLVEAAKLAEKILGHPLNGHVSKAGPMPYGDDLYPEDLPRIETLDQAQHFRLGPSVYEGMPSPWNRPIAMTEDQER
jgi:hydroxymethylglutaryl-CoA lyase